MSNKRGKYPINLSQIGHNNDAVRQYCITTDGFGGSKTPLPKLPTTTTNIYGNNEAARKRKSVHLNEHSGASLTYNGTVDIMIKNPPKSTMA